MLAHVEQDVAERPTCGARRLQRASVVAIRKHPTATPQSPIDGPCDADSETLNAARQCAPIFGLRKQVQGVALDTEMHEPKAKTFAAGRQRAAHLDEQRALAQGS